MAWIPLTFRNCGRSGSVASSLEMSNSTPPSAPPSAEVAAGRGVFVTTQWSMVLSAAGDGSTQAQGALERLCRIYWFPLYAYVRRRGHSAEDAQDLTQAFFARLLERHWLGAADRECGRFRTFLLTAMSRFLSDEWDKLRAQKRGAGFAHVPLQLDSAETRYGHEPADVSTPERCFERRWALTLLDTVLERLRMEYEVAGKGPLFKELHPTLVGSREVQPYGALAERLGMAEGAVKVAVHRLRKRYRYWLRAEITETIAKNEDVDEELRHLRAVLAGN